MGQFVISLDFEKFWGIRDKRTIKDYKLNLENVDIIVLELLKLFEEEKIHATWATVGMLAFNSKKDLLNNIPNQLPTYVNMNLSPYNYVFEEELDTKFHFAVDIIKKIIDTNNQELASHTFSHYYCSEDGQTEACFNLDLNKRDISNICLTSEVTISKCFTKLIEYYIYLLPNEMLKYLALDFMNKFYLIVERYYNDEISL